MDSSLHQHRPVLFISYPRTTTNLLLQILNIGNQPNVLTGPYQSGYHFMAIFKYQMKNGILDVPESKWTEEQRSSIGRMYQENFRELEETRLRAQKEHKLFFTKEHIPFLIDPVFQERYLQETGLRPEEPFVPLDDLGSVRSAFNCTLFSDDYLALWRPLFLIRHPLKTFPSLLRLENPTTKERQYASYTLFYFLRSLYDYYTDVHIKENLPEDEHSDNKSSPVHLRWPIIIDADDYMEHPEMVERLAVTMGLDLSKLQYSWTAEDSGKPAGHMLKTLMGSTGIESDKLSRGLTIEGEMSKWVEEFGEEQAEILAKRVRDALPDYKYLVSRRVKP